AAKRREESERQRVIEEQARMAKAFRRRSQALAIGLVIALFAIVFAVANWWQKGSALADKSLALDEVQKKQGVVDQYMKEREGLFTQLENAKSLNQSLISAEDTLYRDPTVAVYQYNDLLDGYEKKHDDKAAAIFYAHQGEAYYWSEKFEDALQAYTNALARVDRSGSDSRSNGFRAYIYNREAAIYMDWGDGVAGHNRASATGYYKKAEKLYDTAARLAPGDGRYHEANRGSEAAARKVEELTGNSDQ